MPADISKIDSDVSEIVFWPNRKRFEEEIERHAR